MTKQIDTKTAFAYWVIIFGTFAIVFVNPLTTRLAFDWFYGRTVYPATIDLYVAISIFLASRYALRPTQPRFRLLVTVVVLFVPSLVLLELGIAYNNQRPIEDDDYRIEGTHRPSKSKGWELIPDATGYHFSKGNFEVSYEIDSHGRKAIPHKRGARQSLHFFGDSFLFGHGVANSETALNVMSDRVGDRINIYNYGVMGYGLEQMLVSLRESPSIKTGDAVVFMPTAIDIERNLVDRKFVCAQYFNSLANKQRDDITSFPMITPNGIKSVELNEHCSFVRDRLLNVSAMLMGRIYSAYMRRPAVRKKILETGKVALATARGIAKQRGASFLVVLIARPSECLVARHDVDWSSIEHDTLLGTCPDDVDQVNRLRFPTDGHLSIAGNQWLADSLYDLMIRKEYFED